MSKSTKSSLRIVLVDPLGDILFSGESVIAGDLPQDPQAHCPETLRSSGVGSVGRVVGAGRASAPPPDPASDDDMKSGMFEVARAESVDPDVEIRSPKTRTNAA